MADDTNENDQLVIGEETTVSTKEMAILLGLTVRRIQQLIQDGTFKTQTKGRLLLIDCVRSYFELVSTSQKTDEEKKLDKAKIAAEVKLKAAKATMAHLQAEELKGKMHRSEDVQAFTQSLVDTIKQGLLSLPGRMAVELSLCETAEECSVIIKDTVKDLLLELSEFEYDPEKYEAMVRERENLSEKTEDDSDDL